MSPSVASASFVRLLEVVGGRNTLEGLGNGLFALRKPYKACVLVYCSSQSAQHRPERSRSAVVVRCGGPRDTSAPERTPEITRLVVCALCNADADAYVAPFEADDVLAGALDAAELDYVLVNDTDYMFLSVMDDALVVEIGDWGRRGLLSALKSRNVEEDTDNCLQEAICSPWNLGSILPFQPKSRSLLAEQVVR